MVAALQPGGLYATASDAARAMWRSSVRAYAACYLGMQDAAAPEEIVAELQAAAADAHWATSSALPLHIGEPGLELVVCMLRLACHYQLMRRADAARSVVRLVRSLALVQLVGKELDNDQLAEAWMLYGALAAAVAADGAVDTVSRFAEALATARVGLSPEVAWRQILQNNGQVPKPVVELVVADALQAQGLAEEADALRSGRQRDGSPLFNCRASVPLLDERGRPCPRAAAFVSSLSRRSWADVKSALRGYLYETIPAMWLDLALAYTAPEVHEGEAQGHAQPAPPPQQQQPCHAGTWGVAAAHSASHALQYVAKWDALTAALAAEQAHRKSLEAVVGLTAAVVAGMGLTGSTALDATPCPTFYQAREAALQLWTAAGHMGLLCCLSVQELRPHRGTVNACIAPMIRALVAGGARPSGLSLPHQLLRALERAVAGMRADQVEADRNLPAPENTPARRFFIGAATWPPSWAMVVGLAATGTGEAAVEAAVAGAAADAVPPSEAWCLAAAVAALRGHTAALRAYVARLVQVLRPLCSAAGAAREPAALKRWSPAAFMRCLQQFYAACRCALEHPLASGEHVAAVLEVATQLAWVHEGQYTALAFIFGPDALARLIGTAVARRPAPADDAPEWHAAVDAAAAIIQPQPAQRWDFLLQNVVRHAWSDEPHLAYWRGSGAGAEPRAVARANAAAVAAASAGAYAAASAALEQLPRLLRALERELATKQAAAAAAQAADGAGASALGGAAGRLPVPVEQMLLAAALHYGDRLMADYIAHAPMATPGHKTYRSISARAVGHSLLLVVQAQDGGSRQRMPAGWAPGGREGDGAAADAQAGIPQFATPAEAEQALEAMRDRWDGRRVPQGGASGPSGRWRVVAGVLRGAAPALVAAACSGSGVESGPFYELRRLWLCRLAALLEHQGSR